MKILQILNPVIPLPAKTIGGTERIVEYIIEELLKRGHDVTLMGHNDSVVPANVKFIPIGTYLDQKDTVKIIWKHLMCNNYDVIHNHGRLIYFLPKIWAKTKKVHTFHMADLDNNGFKTILKLRPKKLVFTPCSKWIQEKYQFYGGNWSYVNNGLPIDKYKFEYTQNNENSTLVIICRIGPGKGITDAIQIAIKTGKKLIIAGKIGDYPHEKEWFNQNIVQFIDNNQIKFIGEINDNQKNKLLNNALALLIPTRDSEAFNTTMIEANACGCPVISYDRFCFPEFIENGKNGYVGSTLEDLIIAVSNILSIKRECCREHFISNYTSSIMTENYLKIYNT